MKWMLLWLVVSVDDRQIRATSYAALHPIPLHQIDACSAME
jgi:hypothetical protein